MKSGNSNKSAFHGGGAETPLIRYGSTIDNQPVVVVIVGVLSNNKNYVMGSNTLWRAWCIARDST